MRVSSLNTDGLDLSVSAGTGHAQAVVGDGCHDAAHVCAMSHGVAAVDGVRLEGFVVVGAPRGVGEQAGHQFLVGEAGTGIQNSDDDGALGLGGLPRVRNVRLREGVLVGQKRVIGCGGGLGGKEAGRAITLR
ncbi:hypothetical protein PMX32_07470 [Collinsella aerofaciens]|nr:hypothetical protein [Collinsella aerofaciens]MDB1864168.1 hypothetical protein [Collinsella aerofaciens]